MRATFYVTPTTLLIYLYFCCFLQHLNCARLDFEQLVKRNRRENDRQKHENLLNVLRLLNDDNYDSREAQQMLGEKRIGIDFGTARGNSGTRQALHAIGAALANKHNNPGKRKRRESLIH